MSARKKMGLPLQMGIGMVLGILMGTLAPKLGISAAFFKPFGDLFINLVRMVVVPLVLATLVSGAASVGDVGRLGRVAAKTLVFYCPTQGGVKPPPLGGGFSVSFVVCGHEQLS